MKKALVLAIAWLALGTSGPAQDPASRPVPETIDNPTPKEMLEGARAADAAGRPADVLKWCDAGVILFNQLFEKQGADVAPELVALYRELIKLSDGAAPKVETAEFEARIPERDMLALSERQHWGQSLGTKLAFAPDNAPAGVVLEGVPLKEGPKVVGIVSLLPSRQAPWNDLVIDLEFTIVSGQLDLYLRYWPDKRAYRIGFAAPKYEIGKRHRVVIGVKGSTISLKQEGRPEATDKIAVATSRTGGIGFGLPAGSKVEISSCKLKVLR